MKKLITVLLTAMLFIASSAYAGKFEDGMNAFTKGNFKQAIALFKPLALQGDDKAQFNLGFMYSNGQGVAQDYVEAVKWYKLAAAQGNASAQLNLGFMYYNGQGVAQDYVEAYIWSNLAAITGAKDAVGNRELYAKKLSQKQLAEAQKLSRECLARKYKDC